MFDFPLNDKITDIRIFAARSGSIAAGLAANSELLQFRWPASNVTGKAVLLGIKASAGVAGTAFTAGNVNLRLGRVTAFTVDGTGGTAQSVAATKLYSNAPGTEVPGIRIASTAALGAGTKTIGEDFGNLVSAVDVTSVQFVPDSWLFKADDFKVPMIFGADEGFIVRANVPATGVWMTGFQLCWGLLPL
jgi:hypothetical protein